MKIQSGNIAPKSFDVKAICKKAATTQNRISNRNFDEIIIDKSQNKAVSDNEFAAMLKNKVSTELKANSDPQKLAQIKSSIYDGTYNSNTGETVRKLMIGL